MPGTKGRGLICSIATAALLLAGWLAPAGVQAQGPPPHARGPRGGWGGAGLMLGVPLHSLDLTPDQQSRAESILSTYRAQARPIIQQIRQTQNEMSDKLLASGQVQAADLQLQLQTINQSRSDLLRLSAQATLDIRNLLTPDQLAAATQTKAKLKDLRSQMRQLLAPGTQP
jgi:Spy/CpxP family protein refolding chaperone